MAGSLKKPPKIRLDNYVVQQGWAKDLKRAQSVIMAGHVFLDGTPHLHVGTLITSASQISWHPPSPYVSRGGEKLAHALRSLSMSVQGKRCMDVGASTGGFTDCLLQAGAQEVWAVDVGEHLLDAKLVTDPRVHVLDKTNFRFFKPPVDFIPVDLVTIDVSFISLEKILPVAREVIPSGGEVLALMKPQFESDPHEAPGGVVKDDAVRQRLLDHLKQVSQQVGFVCKGSTDSAVEGPKGNREVFLYLEKAS